MKYTVKAPVEGYNGISAGVKFTGGVGETDIEAAAAWLESHGYEVSKKKPGKPDKVPDETPSTPEPSKEPEPLKDTKAAKDAKPSKEADKKGGGK